MTLFKKTADRTPAQVAKALREFIAGTSGERDWDDFESVPITDPTLEALRREAIMAGPPDADLAKLAEILAKVEAL